jgi:hypothetical protein
MYNRKSDIFSHLTNFLEEINHTLTFDTMLLLLKNVFFSLQEIEDILAFGELPPCRA